jgi:molybdopterin synthase catalytic subunit
MFTAIVTEPIRPETVLDSLASEKDGACLLFLGVVRNHNDGRAVTGLEYEAYEGMAERTLAAIAAEASHRFGTNRIAAVHRVGALQVGEVSTAIAVATPHREEAYRASRYLIEELKQRLPVWKHEQYVDGNSRWVGSQAASDGPRAHEDPELHGASVEPEDDEGTDDRVPSKKHGDRAE